MLVREMVYRGGASLTRPAACQVEPFEPSSRIPTPRARLGPSQAGATCPIRRAFVAVIPRAYRNLVGNDVSGLHSLVELSGVTSIHH